MEMGGGGGAGMHVMPSLSNDDVIPYPSDNMLSSTTLHSLVTMTDNKDDNNDHKDIDF